MGHLVMSEKERLRKAIFEMVKQGKLSLGQAAEQADISYRQAKRLYRQYKEQGDSKETIFRPFAWRLFSWNNA